MFRKHSLFRLFHCKIEAVNSFKTKDKKEAESHIGFGLIDNFMIYGLKKTGDPEVDSHIWDNGGKMR